MRTFTGTITRTFHCRGYLRKFGRPSKGYETIIVNMPSRTFLFLSWLSGHYTPSLWSVLCAWSPSRIHESQSCSCFTAQWWKRRQIPSFHREHICTNRWKVGEAGRRLRFGELRYSSDCYQSGENTCEQQANLFGICLDVVKGCMGTSKYCSTFYVRIHVSRKCTCMSAVWWDKSRDIGKTREIMES